MFTFNSNVINYISRSAKSILLFLLKVIYIKIQINKVLKVEKPILPKLSNFVCDL